MRDLGVASAAQQLMQNVGVVSGIQIMTTVQTSISRRRHRRGGARQLPRRVPRRRRDRAAASDDRSLADGTRSATNEARDAPRATTPELPRTSFERVYSVISAILAATSAATGSGVRRLHGHQLGHVAGDLDLAGHERLHPACGLPSTKIALAVA